MRVSWGGDCIVPVLGGHGAPGASAVNELEHEAVEVFGGLGEGWECLGFDVSE